MKIEILYFDGCPSWENGLKNLEAALQEEGLSVPVEMVKVTDDEGATRLKFLGSPHFRVDGRDLWPEEREVYSLSCRVYPTPEGIKGFPTVAMLKQQLKHLKRYNVSRYIPAPSFKWLTTFCDPLLKWVKRKLIQQANIQPKMKPSTGQIIGLSIFALFSWLLGLMPFIMPGYDSHIIRVGLGIATSLFLIIIAYLIRRSYYHGALMTVAISMIGAPLYYLLNPVIPHAEWLFIVIVIVVSAQWGVGSGILSAFLSAVGYGIMSNFYGIFTYPEAITDALISFGYFASSAFIIGTLSRHREIALRSRARMADELEKTYDATMIALTQALDARDHDTEGHSERVTVLALKIGEEMGMDETALSSMRLGALLHDVGKIGIPDAILHKPGPLDEQEWELMRQHPQIGYDILRGIKFLTPALDIVRCHHEQYDGSGYPAGLKGENIPLSARIFSVADVYDALTSNRPYRPAFTHEDTMNEIRKNIGRQFDPAVVAAFEKIISAG